MKHLYPLRWKSIVIVITFIENQSSGFNPLNDMSYEEAAKVIIAHVDDGVKIAEQNGLPQKTINFIKSHHAKSTVKYFYIMTQKANPDVEIDKSLFSYNGRLPDTKEEAIVMMADSVEAASRSLTEYNEQTIGNIEIAKAVLKEKLNKYISFQNSISKTNIELKKY